MLVVLGLILWRVFFPALMSYDSVIQFNQAWVGRYNDWHPPLLAVALHLFLKAGRNIGALMLVPDPAAVWVTALLMAVVWLTVVSGLQYAWAYVRQTSSKSAGSSRRVSSMYSRM